jgi:hypothetical protein
LLEHLLCVVVGRGGAWSFPRIGGNQGMMKGVVAGRTRGSCGGIRVGWGEGDCRLKCVKVQGRLTAPPSCGGCKIRQTEEIRIWGSTHATHRYGETVLLGSVCVDREVSDGLRAMRCEMGEGTIEDKK